MTFSARPGVPRSRRGTVLHFKSAKSREAFRHGRSIQTRLKEKRPDGKGTSLSRLDNRGIIHFILSNDVPRRALFFFFLFDLLIQWRSNTVCGYWKLEFWTSWKLSVGSKNSNRWPKIDVWTCLKWKSYLSMSNKFLFSYAASDHWIRLSRSFQRLTSSVIKNWRARRKLNNGFITYVYVDIDILSDFLRKLSISSTYSVLLKWLSRIR